MIFFYFVISGNIYHIFRDYLRGKPCRAIMDGAYVYLTDEDTFVPDMMVVCDRNKIRRDGVHGAPDLVVEVLSPSTAKRDLTIKKDIYGKCGVREYWIVSPNDQFIQQYLLQDGELRLHNVYGGSPSWEATERKLENRPEMPASFQCSLFADLDIRLEDVFADVI